MAITLIECDRPPWAAVTALDLYCREEEVRSLRQGADIGQVLHRYHASTAEDPVRHERAPWVGTAQRGPVRGHAADALAGEVENRIGSRRRPTFALAVQRVFHARLARVQPLAILVAVPAVKDDNLPRF